MTTTTSKLTTGILQFAPELENIEGNIQEIDNLLAKSPAANLWVLPELASSGYNFTSHAQAMACSEQLHRSQFIDYLVQKAKSLKTLFVSGINERECNKLYNSSVLVGPDGIIGSYRKLHLFNREKEFFQPGNKGLPVFETPYGKIGMLICFDWMFPEAWRILALKGAQFICHPSNLVLPYCQKAMPGYALTNQIYIATTNRVGREGDLEFTGQSVLVSPEGEYLLQGSKASEEIMTHEIDLSRSLNKQMTPFNHAFEDRREDVYTLTQAYYGEGIRKEKRKLRDKIKTLKQEYSPEALKEMGQKAIGELERLPQFQEAGTIFIYWSLPDEVTTHEFIEKWRGEKRFILPRVVGDHLELREYSGIESLIPGESYGIMEPSGPIFSDFDQVDLAIIPGLAFTKEGNRMGRGGGFYDRTLPFLCNAFKVGIAFPFQLQPYIPCDEHDVVLNLIVS